MGVAKAKRKAPWKRPAPRRAKHTKLSAGDKQTAKRAAKRAGRPYPNLVDNMRVARRKKAGGKSKRGGGRKTRSAKRAKSGR